MKKSELIDALNELDLLVDDLATAAMNGTVADSDTGMRANRAFADLLARLESEELEAVEVAP